jgi:hypothetical protein
MRDIFVPPSTAAACCCFAGSFGGWASIINRKTNHPENYAGKGGIFPLRAYNPPIMPGLPGDGGANAEMIALTV